MVMASAGGVDMPGDGGPASASLSSTPEWRIRRRRRLVPPPVAAAAGSSESASAGGGPSREKRTRPASPTTSSSSSATSDVDSDGEQGGEEGAEGAEVDEELRPLPPAVPAPQLPAAAQASWPVAFGSLSVAGRSRDMEDTVSLRPGFHTWVDGSPMHFFGVFDGHGGFHVAELCRDRMHEFLAEELAAEAASFTQRLRRRQQKAAAGGEGTSASGATSTSGGGGGGASEEVYEDDDEEHAWRAALSRTFRRVDALASLACACGRIASPPCRCPLSGNSGIVGSTAVVAVLVRGRLVVANCGDSRAVLCRGGGPGGGGGATPVPLSVDHKETGCCVLR